MYRNKEIDASAKADSQRVASMLPRVNSLHLSKRNTKNRIGKRQTIRINIFSAEEDPSINSGQDKKEDEHKEAHIPRITRNMQPLLV